MSVFGTVFIAMFASLGVALLFLEFLRPRMKNRRIDVYVRFENERDGDFGSGNSEE